MRSGFGGCPALRGRRGAAVLEPLALLIQTAGAATSQPTAPHFAPRVETPYRYTTTEHMAGAAGAPWTFSIVRRLTFHREGAGYRADLTTVGTDSGAAPAAQRLFAQAMSGAAGETLVFHLDANGTVTRVDELAPAWEAFCRRVETLLAGRPDAAAVIAAPLRAMPVAQRQAMLADALTSMIAPELTERPAGTRTISVPAQVPGGGAVTLPGSQQLLQPSPETVELITTAEGDTTGAQPMHVRVHSDRSTDVATGLVRRDVRTTEAASVAAPADGPHLTIETRAELTAW